MFHIKTLIAALLVVSAASAIAAPVTYTLDPTHTYPSFEVDHFNGASVWRGKFTKSTGNVTLDVVAKTGTLQVTVDASSVQTGNSLLDKEIGGENMLNAAKFPTGVYNGTKIVFKGNTPHEVIGTLTLHGVTKALNLTIESFKCYTNPLLKKDVCGADAKAKFSREDFGVDYGKSFGFQMFTRLEIQVEGIKGD